MSEKFLEYSYLINNRLNKHSGSFISLCSLVRLEQSLKGKYLKNIKKEVIVNTINKAINLC